MVGIVNFLVVISAMMNSYNGSTMAVKYSFTENCYNNTEIVVDCRYTTTPTTQNQRSHTKDCEQEQSCDDDDDECLTGNLELQDSYVEYLLAIRVKTSSNIPDPCTCVTLSVNDQQQNEYQYYWDNKHVVFRTKLFSATSNEPVSDGIYVCAMSHSCTQCSMSTQSTNVMLNNMDTTISIPVTTTATIQSSTSSHRIATSSYSSTAFPSPSSSIAFLYPSSSTAFPSPSSSIAFLSPSSSTAFPSPSSSIAFLSPSSSTAFPSPSSSTTSLSSFFFISSLSLSPSTSSSSSSFSTSFLSLIPSTPFSSSSFSITFLSPIYSTIPLPSSSSTFPTFPTPTPPPVYCTSNTSETSSCDITTVSCPNSSLSAYRLCHCNGSWGEVKCNSTLFEILLQVETPPEFVITFLTQNLKKFTSSQRLNILTAVLQQPNLTLDQSYLKEVLGIFQQLNEASSVVGSELLELLDNIALRFQQNTTINTENIKLRVVEVQPNTGPLVAISVENNSITLPGELFKDIDSSAFVASFFYRNISHLLPGEDPISPVLSSTLSCKECPTSNLSEKVVISYSLPHRTEGDEAQCVFWDFTANNNTGNWSQDGCNTTEDGNGSIVCHCDHLTHFAILLSPGVNLPQTHTAVLTTIGQVFVAISLFFLLLTILTFTLMKALWNMRNYIHVMLCANMFVAQLLFVVGVERTENEYVCSSFAVVLHYMFLVVFMWMLMEGVVLYVTLVKVFIEHHVRYIAAFTVISYGAPLMYMIVVTPIGFLVNTNTTHHHYTQYNTTSGDRTACWLRYDTQFIWTFIAPVILIILANICFIVMTLVIMSRHFKKHKKESKLASAKHWVKVILILTIVMGVAWIMNVLFFNEDLVFLAYILAIFIAGQGLIIFVLLVPLSKQVREAYSKWWKVKLSQSTTLQNLSSIKRMFQSSSEGNKLGTLKTTPPNNLKSPVDGNIYGKYLLGTFKTTPPNDRNDDNMYGEYKLGTFETTPPNDHKDDNGYKLVNLKTTPP